MTVVKEWCQSTFLYKNVNKNVISTVNRDVIHVDDVITIVSDNRFLKTYIKQARIQEVW